MSGKLTYIEENLKDIMREYPQYYDHILNGAELSGFISMLMEEYSSTVDRNAVLRDSTNLLNGDFFKSNVQGMVTNDLSDRVYSQYRESFEEQTEEIFMDPNYDVALSRQLRYMPAQWHYSSYFEVYYASEGPCELYFINGEKITLGKDSLLILAPFTEHATPCYRDDACLDYFLIRSSSFEKVFWEQLADTSIMSYFFRNALRQDDSEGISFLLFDIQGDADILHLMDQLKTEIRLKLPYSSSVINSLMSLLFSVTLRRYEDNVILPSTANRKWKKDFARVFSYIQNNYTTASLEDVGRACGYSSKQISRIVNSYFDMSYTDLVTFMKMDKALALMKENILSMEEISLSLGYNDLSSFYRAFKKYFADTPRGLLASLENG